MSLDDGEKCAPSDTQRRNAPCGVASVPKATFGALGLVVAPVPLEDNPAHHECKGDTNPKSIRNKLMKASRVEIPLPDRQMVHGDGSPVV